MAKKTGVEHIVRELTVPLIEPKGFKLVDVEFQKEGKDWVLRLYIDHQNGVDLDACQLVSTLVGEELDRLDPIPHTYILQVSSPGIERPLKKPEDFERFKGRQVWIKLFVSEDGQKEFQGELLGLEEDQVVLKTPGRKVIVSINQIAAARLVADF